MSERRIGPSAKKPRSDPSTQAGIRIGYAHSEIHEGNHFFIADFGTLNTGDTVEFVVEVPAGSKVPHLTFSADVTNQTEFEVFEDTTAASDGTVIPPQNNNRNSSNTSILTIRLDPTITNDGSRFSGQSVGLSTNPANAYGGVVLREDELNLKTGSKTLVRVTSRGDGNIVSWRAKWYEHTNLN